MIKGFFRGCKYGYSGRVFIWKGKVFKTRQAGNSWVAGDFLSGMVNYSSIQNGLVIFYLEGKNTNRDNVGGWQNQSFLLPKQRSNSVLFYQKRVIGSEMFLFISLERIRTPQYNIHYSWSINQVPLFLPHCLYLKHCSSIMLFLFYYPLIGF